MSEAGDDRWLRVGEGRLGDLGMKGVPWSSGKNDRRGPLIPSRVSIAISFLLLCACIGSHLVEGPDAPANVGREQRLIVLAKPGAERWVRQGIISAGGWVREPLELIHAYSAVAPDSAIAEIRSLPGVLSVSPDRPLLPTAAGYSGTGSFDPTTDMGSMYNIDQITGATTYWEHGYTGQGVGVALIDSGVAPVDGLTVPGKVINGPDLSFESQAPNLTYLDTFGHGTHMAGIIAGRSDGATPGSYVGDSTDFLGVAPDAHIVSVKVADAHGAVDVSQVIAAIDWVVQHRNDDGMNIRVINLSYGTDSRQGYALDPLAYAAEQAWKAGIVVVAATGNTGYQRGSNAPGLADPAYDPYVIAVGATDPMGTLTLKDDMITSFSASSAGCGSCKNPDLVAPGAHIVSLRDPGSLVDQTYGSTGRVESAYFRGSGTSQAAAVVSGAAALIISRNPVITPDQLKRLLTSTAQKVASFDSQAQGAGQIRLAKAYGVQVPNYAQAFTNSNGTGSIDTSRGTQRLVMDGVVLSGEQDIFGSAFDAAAMSTLESQGKSWSGGTWNGKSWSGADWTGNSWTGKSWSGAGWTGKSWSASDWSGKSWSDGLWTDSGWTNTSWTDNNWLASGWDSDVWAGAGWS
jgi:subtilisin family serine protease